jgi:hypothetical protein
MYAVRFWEPLKDQLMLKVRLSMLALAGMSVVVSSRALAVSLQEDFSSDPAARGWQAIGDTNLFRWNASAQNVDVTWDSSRPNSYYCLPLGTVLATNDNFSFAFDLRLSEFAAGVNPDKPYPFPLTIALINLTKATQPGFFRGTGTDSPDLVEFSFFPDPGDPWIYGPSITPVMVDSVGTNPYADWAYGFGGFSLTTNDLFHIEMVYTASDQTLRTTINRNGTEVLGPVYDATLGDGFQDFRLDHLAICSYSDEVQPPDYAGSIHAVGTVDNFILTLPASPLTNLSGELSDGIWRVQFQNRTNWLYTLERSTNFLSWTNASMTAYGNDGTLVLQDTNAPTEKAFYRVRANRP